jgi:hypothetical protein
MAYAFHVMEQEPKPESSRNAPNAMAQVSMWYPQSWDPKSSVHYVRGMGIFLKDILVRIAEDRA